MESIRKFILVSVAASVVPFMLLGGAALVSKDAGHNNIDSYKAEFKIFE